MVVGVGGGGGSSVVIVAGAKKGDLFTYMLLACSGNISTFDMNSTQLTVNIKMNDICEKYFSPCTSRIAAGRMLWAATAPNAKAEPASANAGIRDTPPRNWRSIGYSYNHERSRCRTKGKIQLKHYVAYILPYLYNDKLQNQDSTMQ